MTTQGSHPQPRPTKTCPASVTLCRVWRPPPAWPGLASAITCGLTVNVLDFGEPKERGKGIE